jgi:Tol biopolymer transport system component
MARSHRSIAGGVAFAAAVVLAVLAPSASATFPGANGRIAFTYIKPNSPGMIATMEPDGSDVQRLRLGSEPAWSADGRRIVYTCSPPREIYTQVCTMRADGSNVRQLTSGGDPKGSPSFSPGGARIVYYEAALRTTPNRIEVMRSDGSDQHVVRRNAIHPEWAPNGKRIVYSLIGGLGIMRPDGSDRQVLYSGGQHTLWYPHYTPSSRSILVSELGEATTLQMGAFGGDPHAIDISPITFGAQVAPEGGCIVGDGSPSGGGIGSSIYSLGSRCPTKGLLVENAESPSWQPLP